MSLQAILQHKGTRVFAISPDASLGEVVQKLVKFNCGSLVVCENKDCSRMVGIVSERRYSACLGRQPIIARSVARFGNHDPRGRHVRVRTIACKTRWA